MNEPREIQEYYFGKLFEKLTQREWTRHWADAKIEYLKYIQLDKVLAPWYLHDRNRYSYSDLVSK